MKEFNYSMIRLMFVGFVAASILAFPTVSWSQTSEWTVYNTANSGLPYNGITVLAIDAQGTVWVGTGRWFALVGGGLAKFDGENWTVYNMANSPLPHNDHTGLAIDPQGNVWIGTEGGLAKFDGVNWTVYKAGNSGLPVNLVATPIFDAQSKLWAGSWDGGLVKFDGTNWTVYNTANSRLPHNTPWATAFDTQGTLWIGTVGGGLAKFDGTNWTVYNTANSPLPNNTIYSIAFDTQGNLWIGTDGGGLAKFDGNNWTVYNTGNSGLQSNRIWPIAIDAQDNIWIGTYDRGLAMFDGNNWAVYDTLNSDLPDDTLNYLAIDAQGSVWIGTQDGGLAILSIRPTVEFNGDGVVDISDLLRLIESWGQDDPIVDIAPPPFGDGVVDALDLELLMSYWGQLIDDPTLVTHWALDETEGMVVSDSAGDNNGYALGEPIWQPDGGQVNGALLLDGVDDYVITGAVPNPSMGSFSVLAWVKGGAAGQVIISQSGGGVNWLCTDPLEGNLMTELKSAGRSGKPLQSQTVITDGNWHRIGFVWDGSRRTLYVDGVAVAQDTQGGLEGFDSGLYIGCGKAMEAGTFWSGLIDDVRIYNRAIKP